MFLSHLKVLIVVIVRRQLWGLDSLMLDLDGFLWTG